MIPIPELESDRLILRGLQESDWEMIMFLRTDKIVNEFINRPKTENKQEAFEFISKINRGIKENKLHYWAITLKNSPKMIGTICLWNFDVNNTVAEVGFDLSPAFYRKGIMHEALKAVVDYGFHKLKLNKVEAFTHKNNAGSQKLLLKNKFIINIKLNQNDTGDIIFELMNPEANT